MHCWRFYAKPLFVYGLHALILFCNTGRKEELRSMSLKYNKKKPNMYTTHEFNDLHKKEENKIKKKKGITTL